MLKVSCFKCQWSWSVNNESVKVLVEGLKPEESYATLECPNCRRVNKVTIKQLKRALPRVSNTASDESAE